MYCSQLTRIEFAEWTGNSVGEMSFIGTSKTGTISGINSIALANLINATFNPAGTWAGDD
jgi:hypothetical protein